MTEEMNTEKIYDLIIGISKDVGEIKADIKNVKDNVENNANEFMKSDEKIAEKLEEYFDYAKNRQDKIKMELEQKISNVKMEFTESLTKMTKQQLEFNEAVSKRLDERNKACDIFEEKVEKEIQNIHDMPKNKVWNFIVQFKTALIAAIVGACVILSMKYINSTLKMIISNTNTPVTQTTGEK